MALAMSPMHRAFISESPPTETSAPATCGARCDNARPYDGIAQTKPTHPWRRAAVATHAPGPGRLLTPRCSLALAARLGV